MRHKLLLLSILTLSLITSACNSSDGKDLNLNQNVYMENISAFCEKGICLGINLKPITGIIIFPRFGTSILLQRYENGEANGKSITFNNTGAKILETIYKNGKSIDQKFYYPNGKIQLEMGNNINKAYYENGQVQYEIMDGIYKEYDKTGKLLKANKTN